MMTKQRKYRNNLTAIAISLTVLLPACSQNKATVEFHSYMPGAFLTEDSTNSAFGMLPTNVTYIWDPAKLNAEGCLILHGVKATWVSGAKGGTGGPIRLCEGPRSYNVKIPYMASDEQEEADRQFWITQQQPSQNAHSNDHLWAAAILGVASVASQSLQGNQQKHQPAVALPPATSVNINECVSDYDCSYGKKCIKGPLQSKGQCLTPASSIGLPYPATPARPDSLLPNMNYEGQCNFTSDCNIGYRCDAKLKVCVK